MEKKTKDNRRSSTNKKLLSEAQKVHNKAERERLRLLKEYEQEQERKRRNEEKEAKIREKQLKKEEEERLKEERRLKRLEEQKKRDEEKEAERKRKEEEKRKKEEERLQKEQERKKEEEFKTKREEKQRAVLLGFLVKSETKKDAPSPTTASSGPFMQFQLRKDMRMAPVHRMSDDHLQQKRANLTKLLEDWRSDALEDTASALGLRKFGRTDYLHELRTQQHIPLSCPSTWPTEPPDVQFEGFCSALTSSMLKRHGCRGSGGTVWLRAKLFQFVENYRPAYYGTWRRRSLIVTGRRPFARDQLELDYTVDSDDEWEEEEPGESITQSDNDDEEEKEEDDEEEEEDDDDRFFVPHGYLSDDEGVAAEDADEEVAGGLGGEEMKRLRQRLSVVEYEAAHRRGLQRLKPLILGPIWLPEPVEVSSATQLASESLRDLDEEKENVECISVRGTSVGLGVEKTELQLVRSALSIYRVHLWDNAVPIPVPLDAVIPPTPSNRRVKRGLPDEAIPYLIHLVHKSPLGKAKLAFEFRVFWHRHTTGKLPECTQYEEFKRCNAQALSSGAHRRTGPVLSGPHWDNLSLSQYVVLAKLAEIAVFEEGRWAVHPDVIRQFSQRLNATCGLTDSNVLRSDANDTTIAAFSFPPWQYLSDVTSVKLRSHRPSAAARRRSLEIPSVDTEPEPCPVTSLATSDARLLTDSPYVVLQQLNLTVPDTKPKVSEPSPVGKPSTTSSLSNLTVSNPTESEAVSDIATTPSDGARTTRKRIKTLENFFTPPSSKRPHQETDRSHLTSNEPITIADSD